MSDAAKKTYERAVRMLTAAARSSRDLRRALIDKGEPEDLADQAIATLTQQGFLSDAGFAQSVTRARVIGRGQSARRVEHELAKRGVSRTEAREAIAQVMADEGTSDLQGAEASARKKLKTLTSADPKVRREKLYGWLARQGFGAAAIRHALRAVLSVDAAAPDDEAPAHDEE